MNTETDKDHVFFVYHFLSKGKVKLKKLRKSAKEYMSRRTNTPRNIEKS